jgi:hypothetical protein
MNQRIRFAISPEVRTKLRQKCEKNFARGAEKNFAKRREGEFARSHLLQL